QTAPIKPAVVFSTGGKFDKSFNEGVWQGRRALQERGEHRRRRVRAQQRDPVRAGAAPLRPARPGSDHRRRLRAGVALDKVAREFPNIHFTVIDSVVDLPNVQSVVFKEQEGLVPRRRAGRDGLEERQDRLRGRHGHTAGAPLPVRLRAGHQVRQSQCRAHNQHDGDDARRVERSRSRRGAGQGAVRPRGRRRLCRRRHDRTRRTPGDQGSRQARIGVDSNQNHLHPGNMLTSMLKRVDLAAYDSFKAARNKEWKGGIQVLGLKEGGVDWALDKDNEKLVTPEMKAKVEAAKADIMSGKIVVHDYMSNNSCNR
ncbi:hypothetical protein BVRB_019120, partial [Beta vulgaris subsp. vulgaris]